MQGCSATTREERRYTEAGFTLRLARKNSIGAREALAIALQPRDSRPVSRVIRIHGRNAVVCAVVPLHKQQHLTR